MSSLLIITATFISEPTDIIAAAVRMDRARSAGQVDEAAPRVLAERAKHAGERDAR